MAAKKPTPAKGKGKKAPKPADEKPKKKAPAVEDDDDEQDEEDTEDDTDTDEDSDEEEEESDDEDSDDSDDEESDDEDSSDSDDDEAEDSDDEDSDDEDSEDSGSDDDEDEDEDEDGDSSPKGSGAGAISYDTDDAEGGGLPEGRVVLLNPRTRLASKKNPNKDDDSRGYPCLSIDCVPLTKKGTPDGQPFVIHLSAGKAERLVPTSDHKDFEPAAGSKAKGLSKGSNAYLFIKSSEDAGLTKEKLRARGLMVYDGMGIDMVRVPQPNRNFGGASQDIDLDADDAGGDTDKKGDFQKTYPSVASILFMGKDKKYDSVREAARALLKKKGTDWGKKKTQTAKGPLARKQAARGKAADEGGKTASVKAPPAKEKVPSAPKAKRISDTALIELADKAVSSVLASDKFAKRGLDKDRVYPEAFQLVKDDPINRKRIMELISSDDYLTDDARPWFYNSASERLTLTDSKQ